MPDRRGAAPCCVRSDHAPRTKLTGHLSRRLTQKRRANLQSTGARISIGHDTAATERDLYDMASSRSLSEYAERVPEKPTGSWYGVRTLIRLIATGKPTLRDRHFDAGSTLVEDRVVLFRATSFEDAIEQAETEARQYCQAISFRNIYGQRVRLKYLGAVDAFSMLDHHPAPGCEVYSSTALVPKSVSDSSVCKERFGKQPERGARSRFKFLDVEIISEALQTAKGRRPLSRTRTVKRQEE